MSIFIKVATDYTKTPGGRHKKEGDFSGEDFRESILLPKYREALEKGCELIIDLDGGYGYAPSFLEEAFGGLARELKDDRIIRTINIISEEEPKLVDNINNYIADALGKKK